MLDECYLRDVAIGSKITIMVAHSDAIVDISKVGRRAIEADLIGIYSSGERCLGWKGKLDVEIDGLREVKLDRWIHPGYNMSKNLYGYTHYIWILPGRTVLLTAVISNPNQKCNGCQLPAPHGKPNTDDGKFVCVGCAALATM